MPSYSGRFRLKIEADGRSRLVRLRLGVATVGRAAANTVHIGERNVSRRHVRFLRRARRVYAEDLESANGTLINGEPLVGRRRIFRDDVIRIGDVNLELQGGKLTFRDDETTERTLRPDFEQTEIVPAVESRSSARHRERTLVVRRRRAPRRPPWVAIAALLAVLLLAATTTAVYLIRARESRRQVQVLELEEIPIAPRQDP